jgi:UDP:flavonoid glycosyltransferase YjiC (YdhE family)
VRITIIALGSRGDVQPYVALGLGLAGAGHEVRLASFRLFESFVRERGLDFAPLAEGAISGEAGSSPQPKWVERGGGTLPWWVARFKDAKSVAHRRLADCRDACDGAEAIVVSPMGTLLGYHLAAYMHVPLVRAYFAPFGAFLGHTSATLGATWLRRNVTRTTAGVVRQAAWQCARPWVNAARRDVLGLPPLPAREFYTSLDRRQNPLLYGYSPTVVPPYDRRDWVHVTGYWFLDRPPEWEPPTALVEFLAAGPPPVYIGFGGVAFHDPEETTALVVEALSRAGQRGIISADALPVAGARLPPEIFVGDAVWHDWLFPRLAAAVHHGGAGTTGQALRFGLPAVIMPLRDDQPFWARRARDLGVATPPIPRKGLTATRLAEAIRVVTSDGMPRERARALAERISREDGVARAVEAFEHAVAGRRRTALVA